MSDWTMAGKAALLIVHMQNAVVKTPSPLEMMGHGKAAHEEGVIDNIERLVAAFRDKGLPVVYCVAYTPPDETRWPAYGGFWQGCQQIEVNRMGTWDVEIIDELKPAAGERIFYNWPFNVFEGTGLHEHLKRPGRRHRGAHRGGHRDVGGDGGVGAGRALLQSDHPADASTDGNSEVHKLVSVPSSRPSGWSPPPRTSSLTSSGWKGA